MAYKPFSLFKRLAVKSGKYIYYVRFRDPYTDKRLPAISTGQTSKAAAEAYAVEYLKKGTITSKANINFSQYAQDWWLWDKCP